MHGGHQSLLDAEVVLNHLRKGCEAVSCATGVGNNVHVVLVRVLVHAHHKHWGVARGRGDDHLLGSTLEVLGSTSQGSENARGLHHVVNAGVTPWDVSRVPGDIRTPLH